MDSTLYLFFTFSCLDNTLSFVKSHTAINNRSLDLYQKKTLSLREVE